MDLLRFGTARDPGESPFGGVGAEGHGSSSTAAPQSPESDAGLASVVDLTTDAPPGGSPEGMAPHPNLLDIPPGPEDVEFILAVTGVQANPASAIGPTPPEVQLIMDSISSGDEVEVVGSAQPEVVDGEPANPQNPRFEEDWEEEDVDHFYAYIIGE